jgi:hypothetical protein
MSLDDTLKLVQIGFYVAAGTVAILTYIKAKNGLLNAVNTEYKKRVMDRLAEISKDLIAEYDPESPKHWSRIDSVKEVLDILHKEIRPRKAEIIRTGEMDTGIPCSSRWLELSRMADIIRSDPFIPRHIRAKLLDLFESRAEVMMGVYCDEVEGYQNELKKGKHWDTLDTNHHWLHNRILDKLNERGCGIAQIEKEVHALRNIIQDYFESFDPIKRA